MHILTLVGHTPISRHHNMLLPLERAREIANINFLSPLCKLCRPRRNSMRRLSPTVDSNTWFVDIGFLWCQHDALIVILPQPGLVLRRQACCLPGYKFIVLHLLVVVAALALRSCVVFHAFCGWR